MFLRLLLLMVAFMIVAAAVAQEAPPPVPTTAPAPVQPAPMPTMQVTPEAAGASVAAGLVEEIEPEVVAASVQAAMRAFVTITPPKRPTGFRSRQGIAGAIGRHLLPGVTITAP